VIIGGKKTASRRPISFLNLPDKVLTMEADLFFRLPKLREPKPDYHGYQNPDVEAGPKSRVHGLPRCAAGDSFRSGTIH
jgi:hypothetical protein